MAYQRPVVLVVEDEPLLQNLIATAVTNAELNPRSAGSLAEALRILRSEHIDAITLDVRLPDSDGAERSGLALLAFLRSVPAYATIPVLVLTGRTLSPREDARVRRHHAAVCQSQPAAVLVAALNRLVASPHYSLAP